MKKLLIAAGFGYLAAKLLNNQNGIGAMKLTGVYKITLSGNQKHIKNKEYTVFGDRLISTVRELIDKYGDMAEVPDDFIISNIEQWNFDIGSGDFSMRIEKE